MFPQKETSDIVTKVPPQVFPQKEISDIVTKVPPQVFPQKEMLMLTYKHFEDHFEDICERQQMIIFTHFKKI